MRITIPKIRISALRVPRSKKFILLTVLVGLLLIGCIAATYVRFNSPLKEKQAALTDLQLSEKINNVSKIGVTCKEIVEKLGNESAEGRSVAVQKDLLRRQMYCFADQQQFDQAINAGEQLKNIYSKEGNSQAADSLNTTIDSLKKAKILNEDRKKAQPSSNQ